MDLESGVFDSEQGGIVTACGTGDGLVLRLDGRVDERGLLDALHSFMSSRRTFFSGNEIAIEWVGEEPEEKVLDQVKRDLEEDFQVTVIESRMKAPSVFRHSEPRVVHGDFTRAKDGGLDLPKDKTVSLFDGIDSIGFEDSLDSGVEKISSKTSKNSIPDPSLWDDPDARIICNIIRSGQKIETEHSLIILGDVNSGAEIVAGGDIVVLGTLRGVAHAGAYDETGGGRFIFALNLHPTQLRIGMVISRGSSDSGNKPEIARVDGNIIMVEPYNPRNLGIGR